MSRKADEKKKKPGASGESTKTTVTPGGYLRKTAYFVDDEWNAIRWEAFEDEVTYADVIRRAVRNYFQLDKTKKTSGSAKSRKKRVTRRQK